MLGSNDDFLEYAFGGRTVAEPLPPAETLLGDLKCDVCVIGGGFAGLSSALHLAISGREVVLLEEAWVGWGASGRNAGMILPGCATDMPQIRQVLGEEHARLIWFLTVEAVKLVAELQVQYDIRCDFKVGHLTAAVSDHDLKEAREVAADLRKAYGYGSLRNIDLVQIRQMLASDRYVGGILDTGAGHLDPLRFVKGLSSAVRSLGVRVFEHTRVNGVQFDDICGVATTEAGRVHARHLVVAANAAVGELIPHLKTRIFGAHSSMIATSPLDSAARALIRDDIAVTDTNFILDYFRLSSDSRLLFGGGLSIFKPSVTPDKIVHEAANA
jgi:gamma-glutamylputrescine oxidase